MENASKALLIAGAILLAILLISLGIMIFNQGQDTVNNSGMSQAAITAFNNKFLKYEGVQKGSVVKSLVNEALASGADETSPKVTVKLGDEEITNTSDVNTKRQYEVELGYSESGENKGYVDEITLTEKAAVNSNDGSDGT